MLQLKCSDFGILARKLGFMSIPSSEMARVLRALTIETLTFLVAVLEAFPVDLTARLINVVMRLLGIS